MRYLRNTLLEKIIKEDLIDCLIDNVISIEWELDDDNDWRIHINRSGDIWECYSSVLSVEELSTTGCAMNAEGKDVAKQLLKIFKLHDLSLSIQGYDKENIYVMVNDRVLFTIPSLFIDSQTLRK